MWENERQMGTTFLGKRNRQGSPEKGTVHQEIFEPLVRNCRRTLLTQLMDRF